MKKKQAYEYDGISCYASRREKMKKSAHRECMVLACIVALWIGAYVGQADGTGVVEEYTVRQGDTVWSIAGQYASDEEDIRDVCQRIIEDNRLGKDANVTPGQRIVITHE